MEHKTELLLNKAYDKYQNQDFTASVDNLNPQREMQFDKIDVIIKRLQEATNDIIRKKIETPPPGVLLRAALGGESIVQGVPLKKQQLIAQAGGGGGVIFPIIEGPLQDALEQLIGTSPELPGLDEPPEIDCDAILDNLAGLQPDVDQPDRGDGDEGEGDGSGDGGDGSGDGSGDGGDGSGGDGDDDDGDDDDTDFDDGNDDDYDDDDDDQDLEDPDEMEVCAEIELGWLKLILILVIILKIIQKIITFVLSILIPIIEIIRLAVGAWINPPNIAKIAQLIIQLIIAIILMILAMILQMIWNLLNLDCICDQTASLIRQITKALSTFATIMGAYNSLGVNLANQINSKIMNPLSEIADEMQAKKEKWAKFKDEVKDFFSEENMKKLFEQAKNDLLKGAKQTVLNSQGGKAIGGIVNDAKQMFNAAGKVKEQFAKMTQAAKNGDLFGLKTGAKMVGAAGKKVLTKYAGLVGIDMTKKEE